MRKTGLAAAGLVLVMGLAACGTKEAGTPVAAPDNNTPSDNGGAGGNGTLKVFGNALDLAGAVSGNKKASSAKMSMDVAGGPAASIKANGEFQLGDNAAMHMKMDMASLGSMEMTLINKTLYMKLPASAASQMGAGDKPWVKISPDGTDPLSKSLGPMVQNLDSNFDIAKQMEQVKAAGSIDKTAKETLNGEQTTHYWLTIDMKKAAQNLPDPEMRKLAEQASSVGSIKEELWVNADNLPVQLVVATPAIQGQTATVTVKYTDWGKPVTIQAPPADQVGELPH